MNVYVPFALEHQTKYKSRNTHKKVRFCGYQWWAKCSAVGKKTMVKLGRDETRREPHKQDNRSVIDSPTRWVGAKKDYLLIIGDAEAS